MAWTQLSFISDFDWSLEIRLKAGLTDNLGMTAQISIEDFLSSGFAPDEKVRASTQYLLKRNLTRDEIYRIGKELLANPIIEEIFIETIAEARLKKTLSP